MKLKNIVILFFISSLYAAEISDYKMATSVVQMFGNQNVIGWKSNKKAVKKEHKNNIILSTLRINFDFNKYQVKKKYYPKIKNTAEKIIKKNIKTIEVNGYTDDIGSKKYNYNLSYKRAKGVAELLKKSGVKSKILIHGYGEDYPLVPNTTKENRALNRRVEITVKRNINK